MAMRAGTARPPSLAAGPCARVPQVAAAAAKCARTGGGSNRTATTTTTPTTAPLSPHHHHHPRRRATLLLRARATSPERASSGNGSGGSSGSGNNNNASNGARRLPAAAAASAGSDNAATASEPMTSLADLDALRARLTARLAATVDEAEQQRLVPNPLPPPEAPPPQLAPSPPPPAATTADPSAPQQQPPFHRLPSPNSPTSPDNVARRLAAANPDLSTSITAAAADNQWHPSLGWKPAPHHLSNAQLWERIRSEAKAWAEAEPALASFLYSSILVHPSIERALAFVLGNKLASPTLFSTHLMKMIGDAYQQEPSLVDAAAADLQAVFDRDPACEQYAQCLLLFKGYAAVQCHRVAHHLWNRGRRALAVALQSRVSEAFHVDCHPAASLGRGLMIDHATGVVIGETAVVGDNVSMLHHVTLGGSGTRRGVRHPTVGHGVLLGAGVSVLGPVTVGAGCKVGAGSVVVADLPPHSVAVGVPARVVKVGGAALEPVADMDQTAGFTLDYVI